MKVLSKVVDFR